MYRRLIAASFLLFTTGAHAQEDSTIAPVPAIITDEGDQQRITPPDHEKKESEMLSTKPAAEEKEKSIAAPAPLPAAAPKPLTPPTTVTSSVPSFGTGNKAPATFAPKIPFGKATPVQEIPAAPHNAVPTPVVGVDSVEVSEPAPPTPVAPEADPATQDPAEPTELTAPIFGQGEQKEGPFKIVIRVLNKVTAQSTLFKSAPHETVKFGRLEITTVACRVSEPNSQLDYAGLLDIQENLPGKEPGKEGEKKQLFKGWMYASSPSISALEHPIYDVTMVLCESAAPAPKTAEKDDKKPQKKTKK